jgi:hypothetical protein
MGAARPTVIDAIHQQRSAVGTQVKASLDQLLSNVDQALAECSLAKPAPTASA